MCLWNDALNSLSRIEFDIPLNTLEVQRRVQRQGLNGSSVHLWLHSTVY